MTTAASSVVDTERAFAAAAQRDGQWTAFRAFAASDAVMFIDRPVAAGAWLAGRADPPQAVNWWPARVVAACDGSLAISTGPWRRDAGRRAGRFFTIWARQADGRWKWRFDGGVEDRSGTPAGDAPAITTARCVAHPSSPIPAATGGASRDGQVAWRLDPVAGRAGTYLLTGVFARGPRAYETVVSVVLGP